jgi:hypothetical protein
MKVNYQALLLRRIFRAYTDNNGYSEHQQQPFCTDGKTLELHGSINVRLFDETSPCHIQIDSS